MKNMDQRRYRATSKCCQALVGPQNPETLCAMKPWEEDILYIQTKLTNIHMGKGACIVFDAKERRDRDAKRA